ncbi:MAG: MMPL family transporter, partial [Planctomycetales bacterium]|nr:MMPL family transporter [Planctomycetales bacterium]
MIVELFARLFETRRWVLVFGIIGLTCLATWGHLFGGVREDRGTKRNDQQGVSEVRKPPADFTLPKPDAFLVVEVEDLFCERSVAALRKIAASIEELEIVADILWLERVPTLNRFGLPKAIFPPDGSDDSKFLAAKTLVADHPLIVGQLISEDAKTVLMPLQYDWINIASDDQCTDDILAAATKALRESNAPGIRVRLTGPAPLFVETNRALNA